MPLYTIRQLHKDLRLLAQVMTSDESLSCAVFFFNRDLREAQQTYPNECILASLVMAQKDCSVAELLVRAGQLLGCLEALEKSAGHSELTAREYANKKALPIICWQPLRRSGIELTGFVDSIVAPQNE